MRTRLQLGRDRRDKLVAVTVGLILVAILCWQQTAVQAASQQILAKYFAHPERLSIISDSGTGPFSFGLKFHQIQFTGPENLTPTDGVQFTNISRASLPAQIATLLPDELSRDAREARYRIWLHQEKEASQSETVAIIQDKATKSFWLLANEAR